MKWIPTWCCKSIYNLDLDILKKHNIKYIFTDLDNTLAPYNIAKPNKEVLDLVIAIKKAGFTLVIISNNTGRRVTKFSSDLNIDYISGAKKPFTSVINKYLKEKHININECVIIGDQIMTDIKCAIKLKCHCVLTEPLSEKESIVTFVNRKIDRYYRKKYNLKENCTKIDRSDVK